MSSKNNSALKTTEQESVKEKEVNITPQQVRQPDPYANVPI